VIAVPDAAADVQLAPIRPVHLRGRTVRCGRAPARFDSRAVAISLALATLLVVVGCWSISVGDFPIPIRDVVSTLLGGGTPSSEFIVGTLRLPRVLTGAMVGAAFGVSGAIFQSLARNPLGSPDVIGFTSGAALGAVLVIVVADSAGSLAVSAGAVSGGLLTALVVFLCAWKRGVQAHRLVLVGLGVGYALAAFTNYLLTRANISDTQRAAVWLTGSLNGRGWEHVRPVGAGLLLLLPLSIWMARSLRLLELGDDVAAALGVRLGRTRFGLVVVGVGLAALATASAGPVAFVALMTPPIARRLVRSPGITIVPTALVGALLTVSADLVARRVLAPLELPVGIATAVLGAPYLLWLLTTETGSGEL
jgi:iron complex transport system permease protein